MASASLLAAAALLAAGCGSSGPHGPNGEPTQAARGVRPLPSAEGAAANVRATVIQHARDPRGMIDDEISSSAAKPPNPCALVSRAQAQSILQAAVRRPVLAPQGPTCIYVSRNSKQRVTLTLRSEFGAARSAAKLADRMRVRIGSRHAYCGVAGTPVLQMQLGPGRLMLVSAPCPIAAAFAGDALSHLPASDA